MKNNLILIPARSGSTRVANKNERVLNNKPLVAHAIESSLNAKSGRVVVSTNANSIATIAKDYGAEVPFMRPEAFSGAAATSISVILHALAWFAEYENYRPEMIAFIPPTNPFVQPVTIRNMFSILKENISYNSIVTITKPKTHPFRIIRRHSNGEIENGIVKLLGKTINDMERSQDWPEVWEGSPACRLTRCNYFYRLAEEMNKIEEIASKTYDHKKCLGYEISGKEAYDIDDPNDFMMAELLFKVI